MRKYTGKLNLFLFYGLPKNLFIKYTSTALYMHYTSTIDVQYYRSGADLDRWAKDSIIDFIAKETQSFIGRDASLLN